MNNALCLLGFVSLLTSCVNSSSSNPSPLSTSNMFENTTKTNPGDWKWMNEPDSFEIENGTLRVRAGKETDFFNNPEDQSIAASAPFLYQEVEGDFTATVQVKPDFSAQWNAAALLMYTDSLHWIKFAFENSDATGPSMVSVVTKGVSDDANGAVLNDQKRIWLKLIRKGDLYAMHWSKDGQTYYMARLTRMPPFPIVKVGVEAQCPVGEKAVHEFVYFNLSDTVPTNLRSLD